MSEPELLGCKMYDVEPGQVISLDEGRTWIQVIHVYEPELESGEWIVILTFADGSRGTYNPYHHVLLPSLPGELVAAEEAIRTGKVAVLCG